jgi:ribosomal protein S18 acetylase RimI-like enzyme
MSIDRIQAHEHLHFDGAFWLETEGSQLGRWFATAPRSHVSSETGGWLALSGEPWVGFNVGCVLDSPVATSLFTRYAESVGDLPGVLVVEKVTPEIFELAERVGAWHVGEIPLMVFDEETAPLTTSSVAVRQISTLADLTPTIVLVAASFSMNVQACLDLFEPMLEDPNAGIWVAEKNGHIVGAVLGLRAGSIVGLHCLVTAKECRGQGVASSLVCQLMTRQLSSGARHFFFHAVGSRRHFSEAIGYRLAGIPHGFVINGGRNSPGHREDG